MGKRTAIVASAFLLMGSLAVRATAMSPPPRKENAPDRPAVQSTAPPMEKARGEFRFTPSETAEIRAYFRTAPPPPPPGPPSGKPMKSLPPGLRKKVERGGELPPGWQKKVARGEVMDAQVYAHSRPLPPELARRLPPAPSGTIVVTVEGKVVRLMVATLTILDVFDLL